MFALNPDVSRLYDHETNLIRDLRQLPDEDYEQLIRWVKTGEAPSFTAPIFSLVYQHLAKFLEPAPA